MLSHRLSPLVRPRSVAVVGASARSGAPGNEVLVNLRKGSYTGTLYVINPSREMIEGIACFPSLSTLPEVPEHVVFTVSDERLEPLFDEAVELGVRAATVFSSLALENDTEPCLRERLRQKAQDCGMLLHGGNGMGFCNFRDGVWISGFDTREHRGPGNVALLSQSGAGMSGIMDCDRRLQFCFAASTGQELCLSVEDYLEYVLELPGIRAIGLFLETSRHPQRFVAALARARECKVPIVVVKVGKTELAAELAVSHSGALAGSDASYQAIFDRYGVQRVDDMAQLATALVMFAQPLNPAAGALVTLHDSGGERQLAIDLAAELNVPLTTLSPATQQRLQQLLDSGLPAVNPLDAWGSGGPGAGKHMENCFTEILGDPGAAMGAVVHDRAPEGVIYPDYLKYMRGARAAHSKPVFLVANHQGTGCDPRVVSATEEGMPVVDGLREFLVGARCMLAYRDFLADGRGAATAAIETDSGRAAYWRARLGPSGFLPETEAGKLLRDYGVRMVPARKVGSAQALEQADSDLEYPLVLKTAEPGIAHKTEVGGVVLGLETPEALRAAYSDMALRIGPAALVAPMVTGPGVEMLLGVVRDAQFGPMVVLGFGGVDAEVLRDVAVLKPPFDVPGARRALGGLKMSRLLVEFRGRPALAVDAFCEMASRLSVLAVELADCVLEIDINPVMLLPDRCVGVDSLVVCGQGEIAAGRVN